MKRVYIEVYHGTKDRGNVLYARIVDAETKELLVNATLDYVKKVVNDRGYRVLHRPN